MVLKTMPHRKRTIPKYEYLFQEGMEASDLYILIDGFIQMSKITPDGKELCLKICQQNDIIGELSLFSEQPYYMHNAKALCDSEVMVIGKETLEEELAKHPELSIALMKWMSDQYRKTETKFRDLLLHGKKGALYSTIIRLTNSYGVEKEEGILIDIALTNQQLANFCGTARESVNRMLSDLKKQGIVSYENGKMIVHNVDYLKKEINCENCPVEYCRI